MWVESASRSRIATQVALVAGSVAFLAFAAAIPLTVIAHRFLSSLPILAACAPFAAVGCLVAYRQQRNPVGWLMLALGSGSSIGLDAVAYSILRYRQGHTGLPLGPVAAFVTPMEWISVLLLLPLPVLLFPEGRLPKAWRRWMWCYVALACVWLTGLIALDVEGLVRPLNVDSSGSFAVVDNPPGGWERFATNGFIVIVWGILALGAFARQLLAFRGSTGVHREQRKWLLAGGAVCFLGLAAALAVGSNGNIEEIIGAIGLAAVAALPVGFGIGILQYRLYDIDRIISRTISYTIVTGLLVGVFAGLVLLGTRALPFSSPVGVAAATLAAATLFNPLRRKTQRLVDRRFNRAGYDAEAAVAAFRARLRDAIDVDTVLAELSSVAARSLEPAHVTVWIRNDPGIAPH